MCIQNLVNEILTSIKGRNSVVNLQNLTLYNPNLDIIYVNVYTKLGSILSIGSQDIEWKRNSNINQGPKLCCKFAKFALYNPNLDLINANVYTKFG